MTTFYSGQRVRAQSWQDLLGPSSPLALGVVNRGNRQTAGGSNTGTETGVLRVDDTPLYSGRAYKIWVSNVDIDTTVAGDEVYVRLRATFDGSTPSTSSTLIGGCRISCDDASFTPMLPIVALRAPTADELLSVLLTCERVNGTGTCQVAGSATQPIDLVVEDLGLDPGDSGTDI